MVLAAGIGQRMRPLTDDRPKPLVEVAGRALIDHNLDRLAAEKVATAVVNLHHFADKLETHLKSRAAPKIVFSDERGLLLNTGGGIAKALPLLGDAPFFLVNSDSLWLEKNSNLARLAQQFDASKMDALLLLAKAENTVGYEGKGDYFLESGGSSPPRRERDRALHLCWRRTAFARLVYECPEQARFHCCRSSIAPRLRGDCSGSNSTGFFCMSERPPRSSSPRTRSARAVSIAAQRKACGTMAR